MRILSAIFLLLLWTAAPAQKGKQLNFKFHHLDQSNGLKGNLVTHLLQDDDGYIWISPDYNCIQRYDGVRFRDFSDRIPVTRKNNFYVKSFSEKDGQPYLVIDDSVYQFIRHRHDFFATPYQNKRREQSSFIDYESNKWEIHTDRIIQFERLGNTIRYQYPFTKLTGIETRLAYDSVNRQYWFTHDGLWLFDVESTTVKHFPTHSDHSLFKYIAKNLNHLPSNLLIDNERNLWIAFWGGPLLKCHLDSGKLHSTSLKNRILEVRKEIEYLPEFNNSLSTDTGSYG